MTECTECGGTYPSPLAAALCAEDDQAQDLQARQQLRGRSKR